MSFSYSPDLVSDKDKVRFYIGDIDKCDVLLQDEEINYLLSKYSVIDTAILCAQALAARFAKLSDEKVGDISVSYSQKYEHYTKLVKLLMEYSLGEELFPQFSSTMVEEGTIFSAHLHENPDDKKERE